MIKNYRDLSNKEIATLTGRIEETVRVRINRSNKALLKVLARGRGKHEEIKGEVRKRSK